MPRNTSGVYTLPAGNPVVPGTLIETTWANPTMGDIAVALTGSLPRDGSAAMTGPLLLARDGQLPKEAVTLQQMTDNISGNNSYLPAGTVMDFAMNAIPTGWLLADGSAISRTTYANLFAVLGTLYGAGNGTTTFNLPDYRGMFRRGLDNGRSLDPNRTIGTQQAGSNAPHNHNITDPGHTHAGSTAPHTHGVTDPGHTHTVPSGGAQASSIRYETSGAAYGAAQVTGNSATNLTINSANTPLTVALAQTGIVAAIDGVEARPVNMSVVTCIKAYGALQTDGLGSMAFQNKEAVNITGGAGVFATLQCTTAPTQPNDVARLSDISSGGVLSLASADTGVLVVDGTDPRHPILRPQLNKPFGTVKLDANGKIPAALIDPTGYNYQGTFSAAAGTLPPVTNMTDGSFYYISVAGSLPLYNDTGVSATRSCPIGTRIVYLTDSPTLPVPGWYWEPAATVSGATASQIGFVPAGSIAATDVQAAIVEVNTELQAQVTALGLPVQATTSQGSAVLPKGTTAQRDGLPATGYLRYNTSIGEFEGYGAMGWGSIGGAGTSGQSFRNLLVNSTFQVNNGNAGTAYISGATLAAGNYGHEMWKAGASGGDYSFAQSAAITTITIAAGKSLIQVIEDKFVEGGSYVLSWTGTAQARVTINSAAPSGTFASSPILVTGQVAGTTMSVEFNTGTLSKAQLEVGSIATKFEFSQFELQRTWRYAELVSGVALTTMHTSFQMKETKRAFPTTFLIALAAGSGAVCTASDVNSLYQAVGNSTPASFVVLTVARL